MAMKDGWSASGFLATGERIITDPNGVQTQPDIHLQAAFSRADEATGGGGPGAQYFTVQFGLNPPPSGVFYAFADVTWTTEGNSVKRRISVGNGVVISGTAMKVDVKVTDGTDPLLLATLGLSPEAYYVDVLVTRGARPSTQQPPRLIPPGLQAPGFVPGVYSLAAGGSVVVPVDQGAGIISFNVAARHVAGALLDGEVFVEMGNAAAPAQNGFVDVKDIVGSWFPIPSSTSQLTIGNQSASVVIVTLQLGVEG